MDEPEPRTLRPQQVALSERCDRRRMEAGGTFDTEASLDANRLVFVDETGTSTKMVRTHGRCRRGQRLIGKAPAGHWKTTTFTAGLRCDGIVAPFVREGPMNGESFLIYVETVLAPSLSQGDIVVIDNLSAHKVAGVRAAIEARGPSFSTCRPIRPISIPSRWRSLSSRHCCARPPREPETHCGTPSPTSSPPSRQTNAPTTSLTQDMLRPKWEML